MADFFNDYGIIIAFFLGLGGLATFIWNIIKGYSKRQEEQDIARQKIEDQKALVIKKDIDQRAEQLRHDAIEQASDVKTEVENRARIIKEEIELTAKNLREHNIAMHDMLKVAIREVDEKVMKMLKDLSERAALTNGNVEKIRNEVQDVKEDLQDLWDRFDDTDTVIGTNEKMKDQLIRKRREQEFNRRRKRKEIKETSEEQNAMNEGYAEYRPSESTRRW